MLTDMLDATSHPVVHCAVHRGNHQAERVASDI